MTSTGLQVLEEQITLVEYNREHGYPDLDDQHRAFCVEYLTNGYHHRNAAQAVGLPAQAGITIKREPLVAAFIVDHLHSNITESLVTRETVDSYLDELEDIAMGRVAVPVIGEDGKTVKRKKFMGDLALKIYSERCKLHGIVQGDSKVAPVNVTINLDGMTEPTVIIDNDSG